LYQREIGKSKRLLVNQNQAFLSEAKSFNDWFLHWQLLPQAIPALRTQAGLGVAET